MLHCFLLYKPKSGWPAADAPAQPRRLQAFFSPFHDALALELRDRGKDVEDESAGRRRGVDVLGQRPEPRAAFLHLVHDAEKILEGPRQAVVLRDRHHVARPQLIELRARAKRSADPIREDAPGSGRLEGVGLGIQGLIVR